MSQCYCTENATCNYCSVKERANALTCHCSETSVRNCPAHQNFEKSPLTKHEAFKAAYAEFPSQDSEGYLPDRGSFKTGFLMGWDAALKSPTKACSVHTVSVPTCPLCLMASQKSPTEPQASEVERLRADLAQAKWELRTWRKAAKGWMEAHDRLVAKHEPMYAYTPCISAQTKKGETP
jgi:hypothetical protein